MYCNVTHTYGKNELTILHWNVMFSFEVLSSLRTGVLLLAGICPQLKFWPVQFRLNSILWNFEKVFKTHEVFNMTYYNFITIVTGL